MATPIGALSVDLLLQSQEFVRSINRASEQVNQLGRAVNQQTTLMTRGFDTAAASLKSFAAGFIGVAAVQQLARATTATFAWADALKEASDRIGIGVEQMQRLQRAAALTNVSNEQVTSNLEKFARGLGDAAKGTGTLNAALKSTGISLREQDGSLRSVNEVFDEYATAIADAGTEQEALSLAVAAFGRGGAGFVTTIIQMQEEIDEFSVLTERQIEILARYDDTIITVSERLRYYFTVALAESMSALELQGNVAAQQAQVITRFFDDLFGTRFADAATSSVADLNAKLEESTSLLQRYRDVAAQVQAGAGIATPGTDERILDLERERIALLNQLKRAAEQAAIGVGTLGDAADEAGNDLDKFADDIRKANSAAGEGLADIEFAAAGLDVAEARKEVEAYDKALQENAQETKRAAAEATRLAEARSKGIAALKVETRDLERLVAAHKEGSAEVRRVELAIEAENEMRRLNVALGSETANVIATEIQRRRELTEAVDMLAEAEERRMEVFRAMNEEEMGRRMGQAQAGGMSAPGTPEDFEREMSEPFKNALASVQAEFTNVFEEMSRGTISSFDDIADAAKRIFQNLNANLLSLAIFDKQFRADLQAQSREAGLGTHGLTAAAAYTTAAPMALRLAGAGKMSEGAQMGGAIGAGIGAFGGPAGMAIGGAIGTTVGAIGYGLFGPGPGGSKVSFGGAGLGKAGAGGTGEAAKFISQIDTQLIGLMTFRQEALINAMLKKAPPTSVQYGEEGPSANDLAALAAARIRPAAKALGFSKAVAQGAPEQQMANFQQAVALMKQIESIRLGPLGSELENLKTSFLESSKAAKKFGVDHYQALEEQYKREQQAIKRRFASEQIGLEQMFGQRTSISAALAQLKLQFDEAGARAKELGLSTLGMNASLAKAQEEVREQARAQRNDILTQARSLADLPQTFKSTIDALRSHFDDLRDTMKDLGGSVAELNDLEDQAIEAAGKRRLEQLEDIVSQARGLSGGPTTSKQIFDELMRDFAELRKQTRALGGSLSLLTRIQEDATAAFLAQIKAQRSDIIQEARGLVGLPPTFQSDFDALMQRFLELRKEMRAAGGSLKELTLLQEQATAALIKRRNAELEAINIQAKQLIGEPLTVDERFDALMNQFLELRKQTRALGGSLTDLTAIQKRATAAFLAQIEAEKRAIIAQAQQLTGRPLTFGQEWDALMAQFTELRKQARALGMDLGKLTDIQIEAQAHLRKQQQATRDTMLLSIVEPFKQLLEPLRAFSKELTLGNMNPLGQMEASRSEFERIAALARAGDVNAIRQLEAAGREYIGQMERFGASPAGASAREEVKAVIDAVMANITEAQKQASRGVEGAIEAASKREVDTLNELIAVGRQTVAEIERLSGATVKNIPTQQSPARQAMEDFRRIAAEVQAGNLAKTQSLQDAQQDISQDGTKPGRSLALSGTQDNQSVMASMISKLDQRHKEETSDFMDQIKRTSQREIDTMRELIDVGRQQIEELKRLGRR